MSGDDAKRAILVTYPDEFSKQEIVDLAKAGGYEAVKVVTQREIVKSQYGVGSGKAQELEGVVAETDAEVIIIDEAITSSQANNLAKMTHAQVIDRERLILDIFAKRALTTEAKQQVKLAELRYALPRARDEVRHSTKGEQAGFMGMGEYEVDLRFRTLKRQMGFIKERLEKSGKVRTLHTAERRKLGVPFVSLAGYTSSGKTTLFNKLTAESKEMSPKLFTTLSTTTRMVEFPKSKAKILLSDTVGFISRLPTYLVESFKSTLEELRYADLVLLMVDVSEGMENVRIKLSSCMETIEDLEVDPHRVLLILNKVDLLDSQMRATIDHDPLFRDYTTVKISATRGDGLHQLRTRILERVQAYQKAEKARNRASR